MSFLSIFTPSFNRGHLLSRLYESLLQQDFKDFDWLIVDDGSTDDTKKIVEKFQKEGKIKINYFYQKNQGKHIAYNIALENITSETFITIDSDDYLVENILAKLYTMFNDIKFDSKIVGFSGKMIFADGKINLADQSVLLKARPARKYRFPVFQGEKFCRESLVWDRILNDYLITNTSAIVTVCEYQEDGLSSNSWQLMKESPRYSLLFFKEKIKNKKYSILQKHIFAKSYWDIAFSAKEISFFDKIKSISFYFTLNVFAGKFKNELLKIKSPKKRRKTFY